MPIEVGVKEFPINILLGGTDKPVGAKTLLGSLEDVLLPVPALPRPRPALADRGPCPTADPFDFPKVESSSRASKPPVPGTYDFRGSTREVANVRAEAKDGFSFDVIERRGDRTSTISYLVMPTDTTLPEPQVPPLPVIGGVPAGVPSNLGGVAGVDNSGIYIVRINDDGHVFQPSPPLKFVAFPLQPGTTWNAVGADAASGEIMAFTGRVGGLGADGPDDDTLPDLTYRSTVDACGEVLQVWLVTVDAGRWLGARRDVVFNGVYAIAPQFGGISVSDKRTAAGTVDGAAYHDTSEGTITRQPAVAT